MAAHNGAIDEDVGGHLTPLSLEACPELAPDAAGFPPAEAVVDGVPMAKFGGQITPGEAGAGEIQNRFDEQTVAQLRGTAGFVLDNRKTRFNFRPSLICEQHADGHRRGPPWIGHRGNRTPNL